MARQSQTRERMRLLQLAGLADDAGLIEPAHRSRGWLRPSGVRLESGLLRFEFGEGAELVEPRRDLLLQFVRVRDPQSALAFARKWGRLELCQHGTVYLHDPLRLPRGGALPVARPEDTLADQLAAQIAASEGCSPLIDEPVMVWLRIAQHFGAMLDLAARLHRDEPGDADTWKLVGVERPLPFLKPGYEEIVVPGADVIIDQILFERAIEPLLRVADLALSFRWGSRPAPDLDVVTPRLFSTLVLRLASIASRTDGLARCSACGDFFTPDRRPTRGHRTYCEPCREAGKPKRDAERDYAQRSKQATEEQRNDQATRPR